MWLMLMVIAQAQDERRKAWNNEKKLLCKLIHYDGERGDER